MKPDWSDAPEWANYLAQDWNGEWWWYEDEPVKAAMLDRWTVATGRFIPVRMVKNKKWTETLERRPTDESDQNQI